MISSGPPGVRTRGRGVARRGTFAFESIFWFVPSLPSALRYLLALRPLGQGWNYRAVCSRPSTLCGTRSVKRMKKKYWERLNANMWWVLLDFMENLKTKWSNAHKFTFCCIKWSSGVYRYVLQTCACVFRQWWGSCRARPEVGKRRASSCTTLSHFASSSVCWTNQNLVTTMINLVAQVGHDINVSHTQTPFLCLQFISTLYFFWNWCHVLVLYVSSVSLILYEKCMLPLGLLKRPDRRLWVYKSLMSERVSPGPVILEDVLIEVFRTLHTQCRTELDLHNQSPFSKDHTHLSRSAPFVRLPRGISYDKRSLNTVELVMAKMSTCNI